MSKSKDTFIDTREEYLTDFQNTDNPSNKQAKALEEAIKVRHQEGDRYWTRATYFWALSAVMFTGYFVLQKLGTEIPKESFVIISCIGLLMSFGGYLANRGAMFWLSNYELQVHLLENEIIGPLFKSFSNELINENGVETKCSQICQITHPLKRYPFSVTAIHLILNLFLTLIWVILASGCPESVLVCK